MKIKKRKSRVLPVYINCFLGVDSESEAYRFRREIFEYQVDWFLEQDSRIKVFVYMQDEGYKNDFQTDRVKLVVVPKPKKPGIEWQNKAVNSLADMFYDSDYDWGVFANNDTILYEHEYGGKIFSHMLDNYKEWKVVDCWHPVNPRNEPFNPVWRKDQKLFDKYIVLRRASINMNGSLYVLSNLKKRYGSKFYLCDGYRQGSDMRLMADMLAAGMKCYKCWSVVMKEMQGNTKRTLISSGEDIENRTKLMIADKLKIAEVYKDKGLKIKKGKGGRPVFNAVNFYKNCCNFKKEVHIKK